jgi:hypothetical protein
MEKQSKLCTQIGIIFYLWSLVLAMCFITGTFGCCNKANNKADNCYAYNGHMIWCLGLALYLVQLL